MKIKTIIKGFATAMLMAVLMVVVCPSFGTVEVSAEAIDTTVTANAEVMSFMNIRPLPLAAEGGTGGGGTAESTYKTVIGFFVTWLTRIGWMVALVGAIMFGLAIKNNDAEQKQGGLLTLIAGFVVAAVCQGADMFNLFS